MKRINTSTHLMVDDTTIADIEVRVNRASPFTGEIDAVYVDLGISDQHYLCISGKPDQVVAVLMAAVGRIWQAQEVAS